MKITKNEVFYAIKIYGKKQVFLFACAAHIPLRGIMGTRHHQAYGMERIQKATYRKRTFGVHAPPLEKTKLRKKTSTILPSTCKTLFLGRTGAGATL